MAGKSKPLAKRKAKANGKKTPKQQSKAKPEQLIGIVAAGGASAGTAFGKTQKPAKDAHACSMSQADRYFDARDVMHLPLPRQIAPYTVLRLTTSFTVTGNATGGSLVLLGIFDSGSGATSKWDPTIAVTNTGALTTAVNATSGTTLFTMSAIAAMEPTSICPCAYTVQVMNTNALQTTSGLVMGGFAQQVLRLEDSSQTWTTLKDNLVALARPRLMTAPKLALRGVCASLPPADMSEYARFALRSARSATTTATWDTDLALDLASMLPAWVHIAAGLELNFFVTVEYRVRFAPGNVAHASHSMHRAPHIDHFNNAVEKITGLAAAASKGIRDIADVAATVGSVVSGVKALAAAT